VEPQSHSKTKTLDFAASHATPEQIDLVHERVGSLAAGKTSELSTLRISRASSAFTAQLNTHYRGQENSLCPVRIAMALRALPTPGIDYRPKWMVARQERMALRSSRQKAPPTDVSGRDPVGKGQRSEPSARILGSQPSLSQRTNPRKFPKSVVTVMIIRGSESFSEDSFLPM